jgi:micrococcal nuclease
VTYRYKATVVRWVDGDTVWLEVDLGFRMKTINDFRLYGVDTPERGQLNYKEATTFVNAIAPVGTEVTVFTYKDPDKYGRWLAEVIPLGDAGSIPSVSNQLINAGLAKTYFGGTK